MKANMKLHKNISCPSFEDLLKYKNGEHNKIRGHIENCDNCKDVLEDIEFYIMQSQDEKSRLSSDVLTGMESLEQQLKFIVCDGSRSLAATIGEGVLTDDMNIRLIDQIKAKENAEVNVNANKKVINRLLSNLLKVAAIVFIMFGTLLLLNFNLKFESNTVPESDSIKDNYWSRSAKIIDFELGTN